MLELNDCLYVPAISRNIISVSCLDKSGFIISIKDKSLSVYRKNVFYANANMTNGLYVLDLDMPVYNISAKRNKPNGLNQTYLWHCRLGHINEKRISKLHRSGMLESFDLESYDTCESCLLDPTKAVEGTPYQLWTGKCPVLSHLKIWGCEAYVKHLLTNGKLDAKSDKCFFVGYPKETRGYSFYHPIDKKVFVARNGVFLEKEFLSIATSRRKIELEEIRDDEETTAPVLEHELEEQTVVPQNAQHTQEPRRSNRLRTQLERNSDESCVYKKVSGSAVVFLALYVDDILLIGNDIPTLTTVKTWLMVPSIKNPIPLFCDNNGAIAQAKEPRSHQKTKHIVRRYHIIREIVARGDVEICKIGTDNNIADPLTKALGKPKHESHTWSMGIREILDWP
ncbi:unnamed protein product [Cuscuta campestris]|uniref:Uncharacterized protein n=1 Tax=Cuscuta campestris TaxID=132261 RepID=A0A484N0X2_9ASTE|nr:unnamed protein product [Cuscuta campestris]